MKEIAFVYHPGDVVRLKFSIKRVNAKHNISDADILKSDEWFDSCRKALDVMQAAFKANAGSK